jgi:hypothetical protein
MSHIHPTGQTFGADARSPRYLKQWMEKAGFADVKEHILNPRWTLATRASAEESRTFRDGQRDRRYPRSDHHAFDPLPQVGCNRGRVVPDGRTKGRQE